MYVVWTSLQYKGKAQLFGKIQVQTTTLVGLCHCTQRALYQSFIYLYDITAGLHCCVLSTTITKLPLRAGLTHTMQTYEYLQSTYESRLWWSLGTVLNRHGGVAQQARGLLHQ